MVYVVEGHTLCLKNVSIAAVNQIAQYIPLGDEK